MPHTMYKHHLALSGNSLTHTILPHVFLLSGECLLFFPPTYLELLLTSSSVDPVRSSGYSENLGLPWNPPPTAISQRKHVKSVEGSMGLVL